MYFCVFNVLGKPFEKALAYCFICFHLWKHAFAVKIRCLCKVSKQLVRKTTLSSSSSATAESSPVKSALQKLPCICLTIKWSAALLQAKIWMSTFLELCVLKLKKKKMRPSRATWTSFRSKDFPVGSFRLLPGRLTAKVVDQTLLSPPFFRPLLWNARIILNSVL